MNRQGRTIFALAAPAYLWLTLTILLPLVVMLYVSLLDVSPLRNLPASFTLANYAAFFERPFYRDLTLWSLELGAVVTALCVLIGFPAALALARSVPGRWREALFLMVILPFWSNALVRTFSWTMVLRPDGMLDGALRLVVPGAGPLDLLYSYPAVLIGLVHAYLPYMILTCYISLQAIDESLIEAARSLGARSWTVLFRVVLPLSLPGIAAGTVLIFVPVIGSFMEPRILGGTRGAMLGMSIEEQFMTTGNWALGAALSFILLAIVLFVLALFYPLLSRQMRTG